MDPIRVFIFLFISLECCPVERVNCPPVRAEPGIIRRNADPPKSVLIHLAELPVQLDLGSREAAIPA